MSVKRKSFRHRLGKFLQQLNPARANRVRRFRSHFSGPGFVPRIEPLESRHLLSPCINLNNGVADSFTGGQGTWIQIPIRVDNLQDSLGDTGLAGEGVELSYSTTANVAAQNLSQPADSGFTVSGNTVTVITQSPSGFVKGEAVTITAWNNPAYDGTFTIASVGATSFTYTDAGRHRLDSFWWRYRDGVVLRSGHASGCGDRGSKH
jgi:hypothetical protein